MEMSFLKTYVLNRLRSQILTIPSSPPDKSKGSFLKKQNQVFVKFILKTLHHNPHSYELYIRVALVYVTPWRQFLPIPRYYIDISNMRIGSKHTCFWWSCSDIPNFNSFVHGARGKYLSKNFNMKYVLRNVTNCHQHMSLKLIQKHTVGSFGLHWRSSTELVCDENGLWSICQDPSSVGFHKWIFLRQSPVNNLK